jgi:hypothetical protein
VRRGVLDSDWLSKRAVLDYDWLSKRALFYSSSDWLENVPVYSSSDWLEHVVPDIFRNLMPLWVTYVRLAHHPRLGISTITMPTHHPEYCVFKSGAPSSKHDNTTAR